MIWEVKCRRCGTHEVVEGDRPDRQCPICLGRRTIYVMKEQMVPPVEPFEHPERTERATRLAEFKERAGRMQDQKIVNPRRRPPLDSSRPKVDNQSENDPGKPESPKKGE